MRAVREALTGQGPSEFLNDQNFAITIGKPCSADARRNEPREPLESSSRHGCAAHRLFGDSCTRSGAAGQGWRQPGEAFPWGRCRKGVDPIYKARPNS